MTVPPPRFGALRYHNFRLFFYGQAVSLMGTWMQTVALGWLVLGLTDSPFYVGLTSALGSLGVLLFTLYAGVVADRIDKRRALMVTQFLLMCQAFALALLVWTGSVTIGGVLVLAAILGIVSAFDIPIRQAFVAELVGREALFNAIALNSSAFNASRVVGPAIAGLVIAAAGVEWCFLLNSISYLAMLRSLAAIRPPPAVGSTRVSISRGLGEVLEYLRRDRRVGSLILLTAILSVFAFPLLPMLPVFARDVLGVGPRGYGALTAAMGTGALAGALGIAASSHGRLRPHLQLAGGTAFGLFIAVFAASRSFGLSTVLLSLAGCAMIINNALTNGMIQTLVPDHLRGRTMGFYSFVFIGLGPLGAFQAGVFAERFGAPVAVGAGGVVCSLAAILIWWRVPALRLTSSPGASPPRR